jgi:hypothetical protein
MEFPVTSFLSILTWSIDHFLLFALFSQEVNNDDTALDISPLLLLQHFLSNGLRFELYVGNSVKNLSRRQVLRAESWDPHGTFVNQALISNGHFGCQLSPFAWSANASRKPDFDRRVKDFLQVLLCCREWDIFDVQGLGIFSCVVWGGAKRLSVHVNQPINSRNV